MSDWSEGYVHDILYTSGFYRELTPAMLALAILASGRRPPDLGRAFAYCELGCGMGFTSNLLAAANGHGRFHATDFNPSQIVHAQALAGEAGSANVHFHDDAFADFAGAPDLPPAFDIIALHGIYSWISAENRRHIVDFILRKLKPGGLVYISYNALPGWAAAMPLRRLMIDHAAGASGPIAPRIDRSIGFLEELQAAGARYFASAPALADRVAKLKGMSRNYLAHEYFNRDWTPFYFEDVATELGAAMLDFLASANLLDSIDSINLTPAQIKVLGSIPEPGRRQAVRDVLVNQQFRKDIFARGSLQLAAPALRDHWQATRFALSVHRSQISLKIPAPLGEVTLAEAVYHPILDGFARGPLTVRDLIQGSPAISAMRFDQIVQALIVLVGAGYLQPCLPAHEEQKRTQRTRAFNAAVLKRAETQSDLAFLASPVTGGGIQVDRVQQLFLAARFAKLADPVQAVWRQFSAQGQRLLKEGKAIETEDDNIAALRSLHGTFQERTLPMLQQMGIA